MRNVVPAVSGIYAIRNLKTNKVYVGSSNNMQRRWQEHKKRLRAGNHNARHLQYSWDKYGEAVFVFEVIERCDETYLLTREQHFIDIFKSVDELHGYNTSPVAGKFPPNTWTKGSKRPLDVVAKTSAQHKLLWSNPEYRAKMIEALTGKKRNLSSEQRQRLSERSSETAKKHPAGSPCRIRAGEKLRGKKHSSEVRANVSRGKGGPSEAQVILVRSLLQAGQLSQNAIAKATGVHVRTVHRIKTGERYSWVKG